MRSAWSGDASRGNPYIDQVCGRIRLLGHFPPAAARRGTKFGFAGSPCRKYVVLWLPIAFYRQHSADKNAIQQQTGEQMSFSEIQSFSEPSEFAAAIRGASVDVTVVIPGQFNAEITSVDLGTLRIQRLSQNLPLVLHATHTGNQVSFAFHTESGQSLIRDGIRVTSDSLVRLGRPQSHFQRHAASVHWGSISLTPEELPTVSETVAGFDLMPPDNDQIITPPPGAMINLLRLHAAAGLLAKQAPELLTNLEVARGMEQSLTHALVDCLQSKIAREQTLAQHRHQTIMQRFNAIIQADAETPLHVMEVALAVGVSLRLLTTCCQEHLGMGPKKYLDLRRMHLARRDLVSADPRVTTVTDTATRYGFWQLGRFSVNYKSIFGESPSATLHKKTGLL
jgi:AraC-like DNA-binding protein